MQWLPTTGLQSSANNFLSKNSPGFLQEETVDKTLWDIRRKWDTQGCKIPEENSKGAALKIKNQLGTGESPSMKARWGGMEGYLLVAY